MDGLKYIAFGLATMFASSAVLAQQTYGLGTPATAEEIAGWNIDILPDGQGLPVGSGTVTHGKEVYTTTCMVCHAEDLKGVAFWPPLIGGAGSLTTDKPRKTVESYWPYATTLYDYIRRAMPFTAPQSLTNDEVYSVTAYILHMSGLLDEDATLDAESLPNIKMPNRDAFFEDDRPDAQNTRCMTDCLKESQG